MYCGELRVGCVAVLCAYADGVSRYGEMGQDLLLMISRCKNLQRMHLEELPGSKFLVS